MSVRTVNSVPSADYPSPLSIPVLIDTAATAAVIIARSWPTTTPTAGRSTRRLHRVATLAIIALTAKATVSRAAAFPWPSLVSKHRRTASSNCACSSAVEARLSDDDFSVEDLAAAVEQSRSNLHCRLRQLLDESPTTYIRRVRLEHAAALLRAQQGTISEVAYAVGFKSVSHFSQSFRKRYGTSPSAYIDRSEVPSLPQTRS